MAGLMNQIVPMALAILCFVFFVAGTATDRWTKTEILGVTTYGGGLWPDNRPKCSDLDGSFKDACQKADALRAFCVMACIFAGVTAIWLIVVMIRKMGSKMVAVILFAIAAVCGLIAMAIAADMHDKYATSATKLDAGFALITVGWIVALIGAISAFMLGN